MSEGKAAISESISVQADVRPVSDVKAVSDSRLAEVVSCLERNANSATEVIGDVKPLPGYSTQGL